MGVMTPFIFLTACKQAETGRLHKGPNGTAIALI
jgi:hypothetical protein